MKRVIAFILLLFFALSAIADAEKKIIRLHAANSVVLTGLIDVLIDKFEDNEPDYKVALTMAGGLSILDNARLGLADLIITHSPDAEKLLIADGYALNRTYLLYDYFAIFGEASNELNILPSQDLLDVLRKLASNEVHFMTPGDASATTRMLETLWTAAGIKPDWIGYEDSGTSTGTNLIAASDTGAFSFSDMATYNNTLELLEESYIPLYRDNILLRNYYSIVTLNPDKVKGIYKKGAAALVDFLISSEAQDIIKNYGIKKLNKTLYTPASSLDERLILENKNQEIKNNEKDFIILIFFNVTIFIILLILIYQYIKYRKLSTEKQKIDRRFKLAVEGSNDGLIDLNLNTGSLYLSSRMREMLKLSPDVKCGFEDDVLSKIENGYRDKIIREFSFLSKSKKDGGLATTYIVECPFVLEDKVIKWLKFRCQVLFDNNSNKAVRMVGVVTNTTKIKEQQFELEYQALHDSLTSLPNRRLFEDRINQAIAAAERHKLKSHLSVLLIDLDNFKNINDIHGHSVGDKVLKILGKTISDQLRGYDTVARLGGDEFGILLTHTDSLRVNHIAQKLLLSFNRPVVVDNLTLPVSASIGIVMYPEHGSTTSVLLKHVDVAMYRAKKTRSGSQVYNVDEDSTNSRRLMIQKDLIDAIDNNELEMYYQPKVSIRTKTVNGAEALLRWQHKEEGFINPEEIIDIAEESGLIRPLTEWVIETVFKQVADLSSKGHWLPLSINLSVLNLQDKSLTTFITNSLEKYNIEPEQIEFEITETAMMYNQLVAFESIAKISEMRIPLAIDDFGTGFSSLLYLKQLPVDTLKIDKEFIANLAADSSDQFIVRATIDLGHGLGLNVVAEGVEDSDTMALLSSLGCDLAQGYFISRPLRVAAFEKFINDSPWSDRLNKEAKTIINVEKNNLH